VDGHQLPAQTERACCDPPVMTFIVLGLVIPFLLRAGLKVERRPLYITNDGPPLTHECHEGDIRKQELSVICEAEDHNQDEKNLTSLRLSNNGVIREENNSLQSEINLVSSTLFVF
jgi:hypothetical protein